MRHVSLLPFLALLLAALPLTGYAAEGGKKTAILIAGLKSHGKGDHEHNAGVQLLAKGLKEGASDLLDVKVHLNAEWPSDEEFAKADTILIYSDGGGGHPAIRGNRLQQIGEQMKRGCGYVCLHYAVEVPKDKGGPEFREWLGGYFETHWSVNPHWTAEFSKFPEHPTTRGLQPFSANDEWYYHMRFKDGMAGVTPVLSALPPDSSLSRKDGPHSGNLDVRAAVLERKEPQHVAWAVERPDGGRGFGFTGGHRHSNWGNDQQRKLVLNAIVWTAKAEVPATGVESKVTPEDLAANLDPK